MNFNTSHVSINRHERSLKNLQSIISIHLMFLLIGYRRLCIAEMRHFNTSHVSINHYCNPLKSLDCTISIHLMFLLI